MAFGKDPQSLNPVAPFGGNFHQKQQAAMRKPKRTGHNVPHWVDQFKPNDVVADTIRTVPVICRVSRVADNEQLYEEDVPWYEYSEHYHGSFKKSSICSAGSFRFFRDKRDPCYGCDIYWEDFTIRKAIEKEKGIKPNNPKRVNLRDMFALCVIDMALFHKMPQADENGQIQFNPNTKEPYWEWQKCRGVGCHGCMQGTESKQGRMLTWPMGKNHFTALNGYAEYIGNCCAVCGGRDCMDWQLWQCGSPDCGHPIIRKASTTYDMRQIKEITSQPFHCKQCNMVVYLQEVVTCTRCSLQQMMGARATIFDVDLQVKTQRSNDPNTNQTQLIIPAFSDPRPVAPAYAELIKKPIDLKARFSPTSLELQAKLFNYTPPQAQQQAPQQPQDPAQYAQPYGQQGMMQQPQQPQQFYQQPPYGGPQGQS